MVGGGGHPAVIVVLLPEGQWAAGALCRLEDDETHHLRVRRAEAGDVVGVRNGAGLVGGGRLSRDGQGWVVEIEQTESVPRPPETVLAVGAGDRDRFGWLVEKATELGVSAVVPVDTARTAGVATRLRAGALDKLRRQALEALKQSGAAWATAVGDPVSLDEFLEPPRADSRWLADQEGHPPPAHLGSEGVAVLVGPEGGFTVAEREAIVGAGFHPTRLGPHTLRFETAAIAAAASVQAARFRGSHG
jgi:16S rRNA (uracil1498-N3)-methyltransferase